MTGPVLSRRHLLRNATAAMTALPFLRAAALSADTSGYKALVCVFLRGGIDTHDTIIPCDESNYADWLAQRQPLVDAFADAGAAGVRDRTSLLPLNPVNAGEFGSRRFGVPAELGPLRDLFEQNELSVIPNVGPLIEETTRQTYKDETVQLPQRLRSHNDQQYIWESLAVEGAVNGWGGRICDVAAAGFPYASISVGNQSVFVSGARTEPVQLRSGGVRKVYASGNRLHGSVELADVLREHYREAGGDATNYFMRDIRQRQATAVDRNLFLADILNTQTLGDAARIDGNGLSKQLGTVADTIAARTELGASRQVFFVSKGGFDTHDGHVGRMPALHSDIATAIASFYAVLKANDLADKVTIFTASDFGRTLRVNSSGTDHGWGCHHFALGGAVSGGRIAGPMPLYAEEHDQDADRGVLIPQYSIEQYGAAFARWFGLTDSELDEVFPTLGNFDRNALVL